MDKKVIGKRLRQERQWLSLTREQFSEKIEISPQFLAEIENGTKGMSAETLYKICEKTNISADYLLLGRQSSGNENTPAVELLLKIPPRYSHMVETILQAYLNSINLTPPS